MKAFIVVLLFAGSAIAQILNLAELNTKQIAALDPQKTVIIIPGGILEEHGPYLPSYTDGYMTQRLSRDLAESIIARPGWTVVLVPEIPLGHGGANIIGRKYSFPGSYTVRATTLREVYMDLGDAFGQQGFRWIFILHDHGAPEHHHAINDATDYFHDTYGGQMVHLFGIADVYFSAASEKLISPEQVKKNGLPVHADLFEQSSIMFLRPDLVPATVQSAPTLAGAEVTELERLAKAPDWPGYFGLVKEASASIGARDYLNIVAKVDEIANKILDGADPRSWPRYYTVMEQDLATQSIDRDDMKNDAQLEKKHQAWLAKQPGTNAATNQSVGTATPGAAAPSADALLALDKQANEAYFKGDSKFFEQTLSDKLVMHEEGHRMTKASVIKRIAGNKCEMKTVKLDEPQMAKIDADTYLLSYKATFDARCVGSDGKMRQVPSPTRAATLWARSGDRWLVAYHGQTLIIDPKNPPVATVESKSPPEKENSSKSAADPLTNDLVADETRVWKAWKEKDAKKADALTAANLSFENIFGSYFSNKADTIKNWTGPYCDVKSISVTDGAASLVSPTVAILTSKGSAEGSCSGQKLTHYHVYGTSVYVKDADSWKLAFTLNRPLE